MFYLAKPENFNPKLEAAGCFIEHAGKIILIQRQDDRSEGNTWALPAGKLEAGESPLDAVLREIKEETNIEISPSRINYLAKIYVRYPTYDSIFHGFKTILDYEPVVVIDPKEQKDFVWITPADALAMPLIQDLEAGIKMFYDL